MKLESPASDEHRVNNSDFFNENNANEDANFPEQF